MAAGRSAPGAAWENGTQIGHIRRPFSLPSEGRLIFVVERPHAQVGGTPAVVGEMQLPASVKSTDARKQVVFRAFGRIDRRGGTVRGQSDQQTFLFSDRPGDDPHDVPFDEPPVREGRPKIKVPLKAVAAAGGGKPIYRNDRAGSPGLARGSSNTLSVCLLEEHDRPDDAA